jgi:replicative DNA helicase
VASAANIEYHARIVAEKYALREVIRICEEFMNRSFDDQDDPFELMDEMHSELSSVRNVNSDHEQEESYATSINERVAQKVKMVLEGVLYSGLPTGNSKLDKTIGGFCEANLIILAARPAMGKSVKALDYAKVAAKTGARVQVFSLEMSKKELIDRQLVEEARVFLHDYRANKINHYDLEKIKVAGRELSKLPIDIYDKPAVTVNYIRKKCKKAIKRYGSIGMIVIDYLQLMSGEGKQNNREQEVSTISRELKGLAKELNVPIIALAQLSRAVMLVKDRRPDLSHLRESGAIEQDADIVMFIYRPSYYFEYGKHPDEEYAPHNISSFDYENASELLIAKNRNGIPNSKIIEKFYGQFSTFSDEALAQELDFIDIEPETEDPF